LNKLLQTTVLALHCMVRYYKLLYFRVSKQQCTTQQPWGLACALPDWLAVVARTTVGMLVLQGRNLGSLEWAVHCLAHLHTTSTTTSTVALQCDRAVVSLQARLSNADGIPASNAAPAAPLHLVARCCWEAVESGPHTSSAH